MRSSGTRFLANIRGEPTRSRTSCRCFEDNNVVRGGQGEPLVGHRHDRHRARPRRPRVRREAARSSARRRAPAAQGSAADRRRAGEGDGGARHRRTRAQRRPLSRGEGRAAPVLPPHDEADDVRGRRVADHGFRTIRCWQRSRSYAEGEKARRWSPCARRWRRKSPISRATTSSRSSRTSARRSLASTASSNAGYKLLGLQTCFTAGPTEGSARVDGAGSARRRAANAAVIHTDEKGFTRVRRRSPTTISSRARKQAREGQGRCGSKAGVHA